MLLYRSVRFSRSRSSPVIIPPSLVATIFLRNESTTPEAPRSRRVSASVAGGVCSLYTRSGEPLVVLCPVHHYPPRHAFQFVSASRTGGVQVPGGAVSLNRTS